MYRFIDDDGTEHHLDDVTAFARAVRNGDVTDDTLVYSDEFDRWQPAGDMDLYAFAANTEAPVAGTPTPEPEPGPAEDAERAKNADDPEPEPRTPTDTATVLRCRTCETEVLPSDRFCPGCSGSLSSDTDVFRTAADPRPGSKSTSSAAPSDKPAWGIMSPLLPRTTRRNYLFWTIIAAIDLLILESSTSPDAELVFGMLALVLGVVQIVAAVGRLHDTGNSGWWAVLAIVPFINLGLGIYLLFGQPDDGLNEFGPNPRGAAA